MKEPEELTLSELLAQTFGGVVSEVRLDDFIPQIQQIVVQMLPEDKQKKLTERLGSIHGDSSSVLGYKLIMLGESLLASRDPRNI